MLNELNLNKDNKIIKLVKRYINSTNKRHKLTDKDLRSIRFRKNKSKIKLMNIIRRYKSNRSSVMSENYNETQARNEYIDDFLRAFGWDVSNHHVNNVVVENYLPNTKKLMKPDYTLYNKSQKAIVVEAEKPYKNLNKDMQPSWQARVYGWNAQTKIGLLTNFETLKIFFTAKPLSREKEPHKLLKNNQPIPNEYQPYIYMTFKDYLKRFNTLWALLSYDSVCFGLYDYIIKKSSPYDEDKTNLNKYFLNDMQTWQQKITQNLLCSSSYIKDNYQINNKKNRDQELIDQANDDTETFIDQLIFLRFAEDNSLEPRTFIHDELINSTQFDKHLLKLDRKYNSGIFHEYNIAKYLSNSMIKALRKHLVYDTPYDFSIIPVSILGQIYERFIQFKVTARPKGAAIALYNKKTKQWMPTNVNTVLVDTRQVNIKVNSKYIGNKSVVPTPPRVARVIAKLSLGRKLRQINTINELFQLNVADLSTGSGSFLQIAYEMIKRRLEKLSKGSLNPHQMFIYEQKIITSDLYGIDINKHATQVTKFSLALRLLKGNRESYFTKPAIPSMNYNIVTFNALISDDDVVNYQNNYNLHHYKKFNINNYINDIIKYVKPRSTNNKKLKIWNNIKFDVILGNPPYLQTKEMKKESNVSLNIYKNKFKSAKWQFDKYFLFIEQSLRLLKSDGIASYIVPNKFAKTKGGAALRNLFIKGQYLQRFIDFGATQLFPGETIYVSILVFTKHPNRTMNYEEIKSLNDIGNVKHVRYSYGTGSHSKCIYPLTASRYSLNDNSNSIWPLTSNTRLLNEYWLMNKLPRLSSVITRRNGVQSSANDVFLTPNLKGEYYHFNSDGKTITLHKKVPVIINGKRKKVFRDFKIEKDLCRPFFYKDGELSLRKVNPKHILIFPYRNGGKLIDVKIMKKKYPLTFSYLSYFITRLRHRSLSNNNKRTQWYAFGRDQALDLRIWKQPKLLVQVLSNHPNTGYDVGGTIIASGETAGYIPIFANSHSRYNLKYIEAWMNYPLIDKLFKLLSTIFNDDYWTHGTNLYQYIPFLSIDFNDKKQYKLYQNIIKYTDKLNGLVEKPYMTRKDTQMLYNTRNIYMTEIKSEFRILFKLEGILK